MSDPGDAASRPNVVLIMADQWRGDCLSGAGHPVVSTPYLDALAGRGVRFDRAYSAVPTCVPARTALHTGLSQRTHGRVSYLDGVDWDYPTTLAGELTRAGYQTEAVGKLHVHPERSRIGFEHVVLHSPTGLIRTARQQGRDPDLIDDYLPWLRRELGRDATFFDHGLDSNSLVARPWDKPEHTHPTNFVATQAADFLRRRDPRAPFFLFASFNAPHPPYDPPAWAFEQYLDAPMPDPPVGDWADVFAQFRRPGDPAAFAAEVSPAALRRARAGYYGHMSHVDQQVNFLLGELDQHGLADSTYVCFVADHGEMLGDHHLFRKAFPYEGSARIPMILAGPPGSDLAGGAVRDEVVELRDVMPTLLECAGVPVPASVEGHSLLELARGGAGAGWRDVLHGEHILFEQSLHWLTDGRTKYVWFSGSGHEQLFDLVDDPAETHDLAAGPGGPSRVAPWRERLIRELTDRPEGFTDGAALVTGRPVHPSLPHLR
ncbi:arylsulfatase [Jiangella alba]|uniref:Arylsulfatase A n=1 Tax=Jiangella alba TaxID=561176 RepID=A0A1H5DB11_9ACTN|nr:arylsulfatase [Jiangella alba]SED75920.1 Arylsulfatase A [Jiangella alba]